MLLSPVKVESRLHEAVCFPPHRCRSSMGTGRIKISIWVFAPPRQEGRLGKDWSNRLGCASAERLVSPVKVKRLHI